MLKWFRALMPKEDRFFDLFEQHTTLVVAGAESLRAGLEGDPEVESRIRAATRGLALGCTDTSWPLRPDKGCDADVGICVFRLSAHENSCGSRDLPDFHGRGQ